MPTTASSSRFDAAPRGVRTSYEFVEGWGMTVGAHAKVLRPRSVDELRAAFELARRDGVPLALRGTGCSYGDASVNTRGHVLDVRGWNRILAWDRATGVATCEPGVTLEQLWKTILPDGWWPRVVSGTMFPTLAGAAGMNIHGKNNYAVGTLGDAIRSFDLVTPKGELLTCDRATNADVFHAARVNLGAFGAVSEVTLQNQPLKRVLKRTTAHQLDAIIEDWPNLIAQHRNVEFYAIPFTGLAALITVDETDRPVSPRGPDGDVDAVMELKKLRDLTGFLPGVRRSLAQAGFKDAPPEEAVDEGWKLLSNERPVRFNEMEYHLPLEVQMTALREVIAAIEKHRPDVFFPIEARVIDADDAWLSPFFERVSGSIAVHAYYKDDYQFLFELVEPILRKHGGRPHWGKLHSLKAADFATLYPRFKDAAAVREALDPEGRMLNDHLRAVFING